MILLAFNDQATHTYLSLKETVGVTQKRARRTSLAICQIQINGAESTYPTTNEPATNHIHHCFRVQVQEIEGQLCQLHP